MKRIDFEVRNRIGVLVYTADARLLAFKWAMANAIKHNDELYVDEVTVSRRRLLALAPEATSNVVALRGGR